MPFIFSNFLCNNREELLNDSSLFQDDFDDCLTHLKKILYETFSFKLGEITPFGTRCNKVCAPSLMFFMACWFL